MNLTTYIIDDEDHAVLTLKDYVEKTAELVLAGVSTDPITALPELTGPTPPDLVLLDVDMPGMSGIEVARLLPERTKIIFITSFREFGVEAFELSAIDYLLKPISYGRFFQAIQKIKEKQPEPDVKERSFFFVKGDTKEKYLKVFTSQIIHITAAQNYIEIFVPHERIVTYLTLKEVLSELPQQDFIQVHRSHIISRAGLKAIENGQLRMDNQHLIPIGPSYHDRFFQWLGPNFVISKRLREH